MIARSHKRRFSRIFRFDVITAWAVFSRGSSLI